MPTPLRTLALLLLLAPLPSVAQVGTPVPPATAELEALDAYIREAVEDWRIPGLAIAVVRDGELLMARGYGERVLGSGEPVDEHTLFAIASTTKAMTAAGLGMLVDEGALDWDDPVREHLSWFELEDPYVTRHTTVRDLLTHRTGVSRSDNVWIAAPIDRAEMLRRARFLPQTRGFREGYGYNNLMYMVAGEVVSAAAGVAWADFLDDRLFTPLGMDRTTARMDTVRARQNVAGSHVEIGGEVVAVPHRDYDALGPAGSVFSSAHDMSRWIRLHLGYGTFDGERLLDSATVAEMHEPQEVIGIDSTTRRMFPTTHFFAYGLGWRMQDYQGRKIVQHTGAVNWMRTQVGMIPEEGIGVVVLANLTTSRLQTALMYRVFDALLGIPETDWSEQYLELARRSAEWSAERTAEREAGRTPGTEPSLEPSAYAGAYADSLYGTMRVTLEDDGLVLRYAPEYIADLRHWHHDTFEAVWRRPEFGTDLVTFSLDSGGEVESLEVPGFTEFGRVEDGPRP